MTRDEAELKVCEAWQDTAVIDFHRRFVRVLESFGFLHLETTDDKTRIAAAER
jgi:hypothetical protein